MRCRAAVLTALVLWATPAVADSTKTTPVAGITHIHRWNVQVRGALQDYHVVLVEIGNPGLRIATTKQADRNHTTSWFGMTYGAHVAVNGSMFNGEFLPCGPQQTGGSFWTGAWSGCNTSIGFGAGRAAIFDNAGKLAGPWSAAGAFATEGVSGQPWLIRDGKQTGPWTTPGSINIRNARTAVGLTLTSKTLIILTVDGGRATAQGMTGADLLLVLTEFAAHQALYLDGNAAAAMWIGKEGGLQSVPSEAGKERTVSNALMVLPVVATPPDAGPPDAPPDAASDTSLSMDTAPSIDDVMTTVVDTGSAGPEDPTGDAGEIADASIYEGPSEGLATGLPGSPIASNATCTYNTRGSTTARAWLAAVLALLLVRMGNRRRA